MKHNNSEATQTTPVLIISNDLQNEFDDLIIVAPIVIKNVSDVKPSEIYIENSSETGLNGSGKICLNYPFTINKKLKLIEKMGTANRDLITKVKNV